VTGRPITIADQVEDFDGIVSAWLPGTEGQGVADVLFGDYDFTGKLTVTWPWYASDIESKHEEGKALFECGYGLKKGETSSLPDKPEIEDNINYVDITENEGKIEAESFASTSIKNGTGGLEYNSNVSGGVSVGYIGTNDWLDYGIYVPEDGKFEVELGIASPNGVNNGANLYVDSELSSVIDIPKTGAWNVWGATKGIINIKAGNHILKFKAGKDGFNFDYMKFTRVGDYENTVEKDDVLSKGNILSEDAVNVWMSSSEQSQSMSWYDSPKEIENKVSKKEALDITSIDSQNITTIKVDPKEEYQKFLGMGTSIEEATVNNLSKMDDSVRREFIKNLLD
ncbi:MAG: glycoside hydrolase family 3 C-terminal domain-containing protein, partial [Veillonella sp.]